MQISVIGTGYVGLVTGACLANTGQDVVCVDKDAELVERLGGGEVHIYESQLDELVEENLEDGRLEFTTDTQAAVAESDVVFIAVGTPTGADGAADLSAVEAVAAEIGDSIDGYTIVVCKSTVPVGTTRGVGEIIEGRTDEPFDVASNPEFLKEGSAVQDFQSPERVVIGSDSESVQQTLADIYRPFFQRSERFVFADPPTAEMIKYASNSMLATKISFINEIANICDEVGADVETVREGMSMDKRIGPHFIYPGVGYGGSCFPKDVKALAHLAGNNGAQPDLLTAVNDINERQKLYLYEQALGYFGSLDGTELAVWGLSFKPGTDDIRHAPALRNIRQFAADGAHVRATDPVAIDNAREELSDVADSVQFHTDNYATLEGADALFLFTEWNEFRNPNFDRIKDLMADDPIIFDGRNVYRPARMRDLEFEYRAVGRPAASRH